MSPVMLALGAALIAGLAQAARSRQAGMIAAALGVALVGGGLWWTDTQGGATPIQVEARFADGRPVTTQALVKAKDGRRDALAVPFKRTVPAEVPLLLMLGLGLLAAASARQDKIALPSLAAGVGIAGWAASLYMSASANQSGEAATRAQLSAALPDLEVLQFTVPEAWSFNAQAGTWAAGGVAVFGLLCLLLGGRFKSAPVNAITAIAAALAAGAGLWQIMQVGGLPWRGTEGALLAVAVCTGAAWNLRGTWAGALTGVALAAGLMGLG